MAKYLENGIYEISPIESSKVTAAHLCGALLSDIGCTVGKMSTPDGDKDYGIGWKALIPSEVVTLNELPDIWRGILKAWNHNCWEINYTIVHCPESILCGYPDLPVKGFFVTTKKPGDIVAKDLTHTGGQFVEWDENDKGIWIHWFD